MDETIQIKIFRSLFSGRDDAYGLETPTGPIAVREPITDTLISDHLEGKKRIGRYPIFDKGLVQWAVIDIDQDDKDLTSRVYLACLEENFFPYLEKSKSKGFHNWLFFDEPIEAAIVRKVLSRVLKNAGIEGIEVFPKQDSINSNNGLGNYVFLPLHGASVKKAKTLFLNSGFTPYEDQWQHLSKIHRTKVENVLSLAEKIPDEPKPEHQKPDSTPEGNLNLTKYLIHYDIPFKTKQDSNRTFYLLNRCLFADNHTTKDNLGDSAIIQDVSGKITYQCFHGHCKNRTWADARKAISGDDSLSQFWKGEHQTTFNKGIPERNLNEELKLWIEMAHGNFTTSQVYSDLDIKASGEKNVIRVGLHRMVDKGIIERGASNGSFRKIDREANIILIEDAVSKPLPLKWPGELEKYVKIMPKSTVGVAGTMQAGKTAYLLNCAWMNKDVMPTFYFSSEFGADELRERLEHFGYPISQWRQITFIDKSRDFQDVIKPDGLNLIDYLEVTDEGEFYKMGIQIKRIYEKLCTGVAIIGLQKKFGSDFGYGGQPTADKPRLYISLEKGTLKIVKAKLWATGENPDGKARTFKLVQGARFIWEAWQ